MNEYRARPLTTAYIAAAVCSSAAIIYALLELDPHPFAAMVMGFAPFVAVLFWLHEDARQTKVIAVHDWGLFLWIAWPFLVPWYAVRTRGRRGWLLAAGLFALILAPWLAAFVAALLWWAGETVVWYLRGAT